MPQIEEELQGLNRNYEITKHQYDTFVQKREAARIQKEREESSTDIKFEVWSPPTIPDAPSGPNRFFLMTGVMVMAVFAGVALAFVISQLMNTFDSNKHLMRATGLPVLGSISLILSPKAQKMNFIRNVLFIILSMGLLPAYAVLVYLHGGNLGA